MVADTANRDLIPGAAAAQHYLASQLRGQGGWFGQRVERAAVLLGYVVAVGVQRQCEGAVSQPLRHLHEVRTRR